MPNRVTGDKQALGKRRTRWSFAARSLGLSLLGGAVLSLGFFWSVDFGFSVVGFFGALGIGTVISAVVLATHAALGSLAGWRAAVSLSIAGAAGGLVLAWLSQGRLSALWCAVVGSIALPFALFVESEFSLKRFGSPASDDSSESSIRSQSNGPDESE